jgi:hypothetical protein
MARIRRGLVVIAQLACLALLVGGGSASSRADAPQCYQYSGGWYCEYTGHVSQAYVNSNNWVLLYFDTPLNPSVPASVGATGVSVYNAALYVMSNNRDFGKALYASLLSAQSRGTTVTVQMYGVNDGYLQMDRIWVSP